jgi:hypothetical protein
MTNCNPMYNDSKISGCIITDGANLDELFKAVRSLFSSCFEIVICANGNYENVNLNMNIVCMYSCNKHFFVCDDQGLLYTLCTTSLDSSLQSLKFSCLSKAFFDHPRQILHFQSFFYVLDSRGLWILGSTLTFINIPHVLHFAVRKSSDTQNIELVCREFNSLFCIS